MRSNLVKNTLLLKLKNPGDLEIWSKIANTSPEATFFHSPQWAMYVCDVLETPMVGYAKQFHDGVIGLLPVGADGRFIKIFHKIRSTPPWHYGGVIAERPLCAEETLSVCKAAATPLCALLKIVPGPLAMSDYGKSLKKIGQITTHILPLPLDEKTIWENTFNGNQRKHIRIAQNMGVTVSKENVESIDDFYRLYIDSIRRWGIEPRPIQHFSNLLNYGGDLAELWIARHLGVPLAATILLKWPSGIVHYSDNVSDHNAWKYYPNKILMWTILCDCVRNGYRFFDFLPSGNLEGVERFKESFGGRPTVLPEYSLKGLVKRSFDYIRGTR